MFFKNLFKNPYFTKEFYIAAIIIILLLLFAAILLRPSYALKTQEIEIKESGGSYDAKVKIYRESDNTLVFETDTATVKIKDGTITLSGDIKVDGFNIGTTTAPSLLTLSPTSLHIAGLLSVNTDLRAGGSTNDGSLFLYKSDDTLKVYIYGSTGDGTFKGGLNLGTSSGASAGGLSFTQYLKSPNDIRLYPNADPDDYLSIDEAGDYIYLVAPASPLHLRSGSDEVLYINCLSGGNIRFHQNNTAHTFTVYSDTSTLKGSLNIGTATGAGTGDIKASDDIIAADQLEGKTLQLQTQTATLPTPSESYVGQFYLKRHAGGITPDRLYICLRDEDSFGFSWVFVASGP